MAESTAGEVTEAEEKAKKDSFRTHRSHRKS